MTEPLDPMVPYSRFLEYKEQRRHRRELADSVRDASGLADVAVPDTAPPAPTPQSGSPDTRAVAPPPDEPPVKPVPLLEHDSDHR